MLPLRLMVNVPGSGPASEADGSVAITITTAGADGEVAEAPSAWERLSRPPVTHLPASEGNGSTPFSTRLLIWAYESSE